MVLFKSPGGTGGVDAALRLASHRTGVDYDYLQATAKRESGLDPAARAKTSTATGLFQFLERTWLSVLKEAGPRHGYGAYADKIQGSPDGGFRVADSRVRAQVLALREDPKAAALMAGELTASNAETLEGTLGRVPSEGELYMAHFLGAGGAADLVRLREATPQATAATHFPAAAAANKPIFYAPNGAPRTVDQVYARLAAGYDATPAIAHNATYLAFAPGRASEDHVFHGLFRDGATGASRAGAEAPPPGGVARPNGAGLGPLGNAVSAFWSGFRADTPFQGFTQSGNVPVTVEVTAGRAASGAGFADAPEVPEPEAPRDLGPSRAQHQEQSQERSYGRFADDPSRPVR